MPARKAAVKAATNRAVKPATAAGRSVVPPPPVAKPSTVAVYAKAVVAFIIAEAAVLGLWAAALPDTGPITRKLWIALGIAAVGPLGAAFGVAVTTNAAATRE